MLSQAESKLMALLAKEWDVTGPPGIMDISDVGITLPLAPRETLAIITDLFKIALVDMNKLKTAVFLTPKDMEPLSVKEVRSKRMPNMNKIVLRFYITRHWRSQGERFYHFRRSHRWTGNFWNSGEIF